MDEYLKVNGFGLCNVECIRINQIGVHFGGFTGQTSFFDEKFVANPGFLS